MSESKLKIKGPIGFIIGFIVIVIFIYVQFFTPYTPSDIEKKAILKEIKQLNLKELLQLTTSNTKQYKNSGKFRDDSKEIKDLSGEVKIIKIEGKKTFLLGTKIKVTYTIDGKTLKPTGGIKYFTLRRIKRKKSNTNRIKRISLTQITEDDYNGK